MFLLIKISISFCYNYLPIKNLAQRCKSDGKNNEYNQLCPFIIMTFRAK